MTEPNFSAPQAVTEDDRTWGMLAWLPIVGGLISLYVLLVEEQRARPFRKFHAVNSLLFNVVVGLVLIVLSLTLIGLCLLPLPWIYQAYMAYQAYQGKWAEVPGLTAFARGQGWI